MDARAVGGANPAPAPPSYQSCHGTYPGGYGPHRELTHFFRATNLFCGRRLPNAGPLSLTALLVLFLSAWAAGPVPGTSPATGDASPAGLPPLPTEPEWQQATGTPYPFGHHMVASCESGGSRSCFVFGGSRTVPGEMEASCIEYSITAGSWSACPPMRHPRGIGRAVGVGEVIYVFGGCEQFGSAVDDVEAYTPASGGWEILDDMPEPLYDFGAACWRDSLVYVFGGGNWSPSSPPTDHVWLFDPATENWRPATPLPGPTGALAAEISSDTIVLVGGWTDDGMTNAAWRGVIDPADPVTIDWRRYDTIPGEPRCRTLSGTVPGAVVVAGGLLASGRLTGETWRLDVAAGTWSRLPDKPTPVSDVHGSGRDGARLFFPGGYAGVGSHSRAHEVLELGDYAHDVGVLDQPEPAGRLVPDVGYTVAARLVNRGDTPETCSAAVEVADTAGGQVLFRADTSLSIEAGGEVDVEFGLFTPYPAACFRVSASVTAPGDEYPENDTADALCRTTSGSEPDGYGYVFRSSQEPDSVGFSWLVPVGADTIRDWTPNPDDGVCLSELPFVFPFYGEELEELWVATDGFLTTRPQPRPRNSGLPDVELAGVIAPFWDDLDPSRGGTVTRLLRSDLVAYTWHDVPRYEADSERVTCQVILHADGRISCNYLRLDADPTSATVGIQGGDGAWDWFLNYCHDGWPERHVPRDSVSVLFIPPGVGVAEPGAARLPAPAFTIPGVIRSSPVRISCRPAAGPHRPVFVYDASGRPVRELVPDASGIVLWDLCDRSGRRLPAGVYLLRTRTPGRGTAARKTVLLR